MHLICGIDFSEQSLYASHVAAKLARHWGDTLMLVYVADWTNYTFTPGISTYSPTLDQELRAVHQERLEQHADLLRRQENVDVTSLLLSGLPDRTLLESVRAHQPRILVVGTHGLQGMQRWLWGSISEQVAKLSPCPVLVVGTSCEGLRAWTSHQKTLHALVAVDDSRASEAAIQWIDTLRHSEPIDVTFVHFYFPPQEYNRLGLEGARPLFDADPEVVNALLHRLHRRVEGLEGQGHVNFQVYPHWGPLGEQLHSTAQTLQADLVVLGSHHRPFWGRLSHESIVRDSLRNSPDIPIVCVPETQYRASKHTLPRFQRILAATDFSESSHRAVRYAYGLLQSLSPEESGLIELCHVAQPPLSSEERDALDVRLRSLIPSTAASEPIQTQTHVIESTQPASALLQMAERLGVDSLCVGTHGYGGLKRLMAGSVAQDLLQTSSIPLFVVPQEKEA